MPSEWLEKPLGAFVRLAKKGMILQPRAETGQNSHPGVRWSKRDARRGNHPRSRCCDRSSGASAGKVHFCPVDFWAHNTTLYVNDFLGNNPRFAYYLLQTIDLASFNSGSAQHSLNRNDIYDIKLQIPPRHEQDLIAGTLSSIDGKIALLQETNTTLESIAQAMFKSWFVDFDPVRAKAEGREPEGVPPEVADLFPSEFEDSQLGAIPKGWRVSTLGDHLDVVRGLSYKGSGLTDENDSEGVPMHNLNSVLEGGGYKYPGIKFYKGEHKPQHEIRAGDVIVANTEQGHRHLLIGFPAVIPVVSKGRYLFYHLYRVRPAPSSPLGRLSLFDYSWFLPYPEQVIGCSNGTTVNMLKADGLAMPRFACPPRALVEAYEDMAAPIQARQEQNIVTAENLASIRDTLLPRLMSGKLRIPDVEEVTV